MLCKACNTRIVIFHKNTKYCKKCALCLRKRPAHNLSVDQIKTIKKLSGEFKREEIAKMMNVPLTSIKRAASANNISLAHKEGCRKYIRNPLLIERVCKYYEKHGGVKTIKKFPNVKVRSLIERYYDLKPRQTKWSAEEKIQLIRMSGLLTFKQQLKLLNRKEVKKPEGLRGYWGKKQITPSGLNGLYRHTAKFFVKDSCPFIERKFKRQTNKYYLWVDIEKHIKPEMPDFIHDVAKAMADFQRWIWNSKNPRSKIIAMRKKLL